MKKSVARGEEMFEDTADNMTGVVVYLNTKGTKTLNAPSPRATPARSKPAEEDNDPGRFSV